MPTMSADLIVTGARVETMAPAGTIAQALAVSNGRIVAVGSTDEMEPMAGPGTRLLQLNGETVLPGFIDSHIHAMDAGYTMGLCSLYDLRGTDVLLAEIRRYADAHPKREWIRGGGWDAMDFPGGAPRREVLDAILPDRPAFLWNSDGHDAWVNSAALERAGLTSASVDPPRGRIDRDPDGTPTGTLRETAMGLVDELMAEPSLEDWRAGLRAGQAHLLALGITGWQDAHVRPPMLTAYRESEAAGVLRARVVASLHWDPAGGLEQIPALVEARRAASGPRLRADSVKLFLDGVIESETAALLEPYFARDGRPTDNFGISNFTDADLTRIVTELDRLDFQVHFHAIGEGAHRQALDAVAAARDVNGQRDTRHHIAHLEAIHPDDVVRFAPLRVTATFQPLWASSSDRMEDMRLAFLGPRRFTWQFPFGDLERAGAHLAAGSDWNVSSPNPLEEIEVAVRRIQPGDHDTPSFLPEQRISLDTALAAFTTGSAWVNRWEADAGSLEIGKAADLAILDRDLRAATYPSDARVIETLIGGETVYTA
jgi:hypothetical protein